MSRLTLLLVPCLIGLASIGAAQTADPQTAAPVLPLQTTPAPAAPVPAPPALPAATADAPSTGLQAPATTPVTPATEVPAAGAPAEAPSASPADTSPAVTVTPPAAVADAPAALPIPATSPEAAPAVAQTPATVAEAPTLPGPALETLPSVHDLSPMGMYAQAHWVVKGVMLLLVAACFLTWTVWLFKTVELWVAKAQARHSRRVLHGAESLEAATATLNDRHDPAAFMARAVQEEFSRSATILTAAGPEGMKERGASLVERIESQALARIRRGTGLLATVGSVAPFVGLFGTVWGIMNAFINIAETKTTNLAVVAPGIAEALFATAIGLVAAIPAVVIYNHFSRSIAGYRLALGDAGAATLRLLSRDIDTRRAQEG